MLAHGHHLVFMEWVRLNLADQKADLDEYLRISGVSARSLNYRELSPASAHQIERQLYLADLEVIFQLISFEREAFSAPDTSRRR